MWQTMINMGKDDIKGRHVPRSYGMWAVQGNDKDKLVVLTRKPQHHQFMPCESQQKYVCQRPAAALENPEASGKWSNWGGKAA